MEREEREDEQHIQFVAGDEEATVEKGQETELMAFFKLNAEEKERLGTDFKPKNMPTYCNMTLYYVYDKPNKKWKQRKRGFCIGRIHSVSPLSGDVFYLRILLHNQHCCGKTSFKDMLTNDDTVMNHINLFSISLAC